MDKKMLRSELGGWEGEMGAGTTFPPVARHFTFFVVIAQK